MRRAHLLALPLGALALAGCRSATDLEPAAPVAAETTGGEEGAAVMVVEDVQIVASARGWTGPAPIRYEITPVRIQMQNLSRRNLRVDYGQFAITEVEGDATYRAIAPFDIEGQVGERRTTADGQPFDPAWVGSGYYVYDPFSTYYRSPSASWMDPYPGNEADRLRSRAYWAEREIPTESMLALALPPGVIEPGGKIDGWLYFEKVDEDAEKVHLQIDLVEAGTGERTGVARLPFDVKEAD